MITDEATCLAGEAILATTNRATVVELVDDTGRTTTVSLRDGTVTVGHADRDIDLYVLDRPDVEVTCRRLDDDPTNWYGVVQSTLVITTLVLLLALLINHYRKDTR